MKPSKENDQNFVFNDIWRDVGDFLVSIFLELFHDTEIFLQRMNKKKDRTFFL